MSARPLISADGITRQGWTLIWALSAAQLVSWGTLFYSFSLFILPMERELGWSKTDLNGALSAGLLVAALFAMPIGRWIDRGRDRAVLTTGSLAGGLMLLAWAGVSDLILFYAIWLVIGASLAATLYEPAFAVLTTRLGPQYRRAITSMTLVGGFASTVFMPLTVIGKRSMLAALMRSSGLKRTATSRDSPVGSTQSPTSIPAKATRNALAVSVTDIPKELAKPRSNSICNSF